MQITIDVTEGLHCAACVSRLRGALTKVPGIADVQVDLTQRKAVIEVAETGPTTVQVLAVLASNGFTAQTSGSESAPTTPVAAGAGIPNGLTPELAAGLAAGLAALTFIFPVVLPHQIAHAAATAAAACTLLWPGWILIRSAVATARQRSASMDTLIVLGAVTALLIGEAHATAVTVALTLIGRLLDARARQRTAAAVAALAVRVPDQVLRVREDREESVPLSTIIVGDQLRLHAGTLVPVDGVVHSGDLAIDEALLTGESVPLAKGVHAPVSGGTRVVDGTGIIIATRIGADTAVARLAALVQSATASKPTVQRLVDSIAAVFVPVVVVIAIGTWAGWWWQTHDAAAGLMAAAAVLVIACPCALGLATPTALVAASGAAARRGIFIISARAWESAARINAVAFDKTGTLTTGAFEIERILGDDQANVLAMAAAVEHGSDHPLALAIRCAQLARAIAPSRGIVQQLQRYTQRAGAGAAGEIDGVHAVVGSAAWLLENGITPWPGSEVLAANHSVVHVAHGGHAIGAIVLRDADRAEAAGVVAELATRCRVLLISGDRAGPASAAGSRLGVDEVVAQCSPAMKQAQIQRMQNEGQRVAFVGDGLNDAPVLAVSNLGIAVGRANDLATLAGDVVLPTGDLTGVVWLLRFAKRTRRVVVTNLLLAAGYNLVALPCAAFGYVDPALAAGAMVLSSLAVIGNSLRLTR